MYEGCVRLGSGAINACTLRLWRGVGVSGLVMVGNLRPAYRHQRQDPCILGGCFFSLHQYDHRHDDMVQITRQPKCNGKTEGALLAHLTLTSIPSPSCVKVDLERFAASAFKEDLFDSQLGMTLVWGQSCPVRDHVFGHDTVSEGSFQSKLEERASQVRDADKVHQCLEEPNTDPNADPIGMQHLLQRGSVCRE